MTKTEEVWKWTLRLAGLAIILYIVLARGGEGPAALFAIAAGMMGLPSVIWGQR